VSGERAWSADAIWALGERARVEDAASVLGIGKHRAYRMLNECGALWAEVPGTGEKVPVYGYKVGDRWWMPMRPIRELLGIEPRRRSQSEDSTTGSPPPAEVPSVVETVEARSTIDLASARSNRRAPATTRNPTPSQRRST
jgi:hypothetical protein